MNDYFKSVATQATAILLAALGAAAIAFFQAVAASAGLCPTLEVNPQEVGALGGSFKAIHSAFLYTRATMST